METFSSSTPNWDELYDEDSLETSLDDFNIFDDCDQMDDHDEY